MASEVVKVYDGEKLCAVMIPGGAWQEGLNFYSDPNDFIQVGTWGYGGGKKLAAHQHQSVPRKSDITQEVLFVKRGALKATVYGLDQRELQSFEMREGDTGIFLTGGHGYEILKDGTQVLEVKNGPYPGAEADRVRL